MWLGMLTLIGTFCLMEGVAWFSHKYLMHGTMWYFHRDHHQTDNHIFQKNDVFFLIFAIPSWLGIMLGLIYAQYLFVWSGIGIFLYGVAYFLIHDVFIHRRFNWLRNANHPYFIAIRRAHKMHHKHLYKEDGECFGMLWVPRKYYLDAKKQLNKSVK